MKRVLGSWRWLVAASALLVGLVLTGVTRVALELEQEHLASRADAEQQTQLRLALWRLDSYLTLLLAREAGRPWYHYRPFVPQERAFTRMLNAIDPGEVIAPSPLLGFRSELVPLHFELSPGGDWTSPQAPTGNLLDLAQANLDDPEYVEAARLRLAALSQQVEPAQLHDALIAAESLLAQMVDDPSTLLAESRALVQSTQPDQGRGGKLDYGSRASQQWRANAPQVQTLKQADLYEVQVGPIVPVWLTAGGRDVLAYLRRVRTAAGDRLQGFIVDWPTLRRRLLAEVTVLLPSADLTPEREGSSDQSLATLPARLVCPAVTPAAAGWSATRLALSSLWLAAGLVLSAFALALRASVAFGERRARFASAVTHELRTPLTTFRMYSEMLAKGMVPPEREPEYLETLRRESDRLSVLVENVLTYARLEEGRQPLRRTRLTVGQLVERLRPDLERRVAEAGGELRIELDPAVAERSTETDPDAVQQILFNLVDNACKYGASPIRLTARASASGVELEVEDAGAGIPAQRARAVFRPFDRGGRDEADGTPGVGLGLALARGLARDLHGELELAGDSTRGARFRLHLPGSS